MHATPAGLHVLTGMSGCRKTYLTKHFAYALRAAGTPVLLVTSTGAAATLATRLSLFATTAHGFFICMPPIGSMKNPCAVVANRDRRVAAVPVLATSTTGVPAA